MTQHTPGPWRIDTQRDPERADYVSITGPDWSWFAEVVTCLDGEASAEGMANARLIASAPDMLCEIERLRAALTEIRDDEEITGAGAMAIATAALSPQEPSGAV